MQMRILYVINRYTFEFSNTLLVLHKWKITASEFYGLDNENIYQIDSFYIQPSEK